MIVSNSVGDGDFGDFKVGTSKDNLIIMRQLPRFRSSFEKELLKKVKIKINLKKKPTKHQTYAYSFGQFIVHIHVQGNMFRSSL